MKIILLILLLFSFRVFSNSVKIPIIKLISDRSEVHLRPLMEDFHKKTGIKIKGAFVGKGLIPRLESRPGEADIVITKNAELLEIAKSKKLLEPTHSDNIDKIIPIQFRDKENYYVGLSYRSRVIYFSKKRVPINDLSSYLDLSSPKWKGKVCIRPGHHNYNINLFSQILLEYGEETLKKFLVNLKKNLARKPQGNDRAQVKGIYENVCDVAIANTYYMGLMMNNPEQKKWAESSGIFFPEQSKKGSFVLMSAAGLTKEGAKKKETVMFLNYLVSAKAQSIMSEKNHEYPINKEAKVSKLMSSFGKNQKEILNGKFKKNIYPLSEIIKQKEKVSKLLDQVGLDN